MDDDESFAESLDMPPLTAVATGQKSPRAKSAADLGELLRYWRNLRAKNQLGLSLDTGISQKQISFIENGRSTPARETLVCLAEALDVPLRERNALFIAAGYAPFYSEDPWNAAEMATISKAVTRILRQHEPFPAVVMDRTWNVVMANESAPRFFGSFINMAARKGPRNMLHLIFDPAGMRPFVVDWEMAAKTLLQRVYREATRGVRNEATNSLIDELLAYPGVREDWKRASIFDLDQNPATHPVIPLTFRKNGKTMRYFSMITTVGTPQTVSAQELRLETMFPADDATETLHLEMMRAGSV